MNNLYSLEFSHLVCSNQKTNLLLVRLSLLHCFHLKIFTIRNNVSTVNHANPQLGPVVCLNSAAEDASNTNRLKKQLQSTICTISKCESALYALFSVSMLDIMEIYLVPLAGSVSILSGGVNVWN